MNSNISKKVLHHYPIGWDAQSMLLSSLANLYVYAKMCGDCDMERVRQIVLRVSKSHIFDFLYPDSSDLFENPMNIVHVDAEGVIYPSLANGVLIKGFLKGGNLSGHGIGFVNIGEPPLSAFMCHRGLAGDDCKRGKKRWSEFVNRLDEMHQNGLLVREIRHGKLV